MNRFLALLDPPAEDIGVKLISGVVMVGLYYGVHSILQCDFEIE